jgi:hypothetical protein
MKKENSLFVYTLVFLALFIGVLALFKPATVQYTDNGQPVVSVGGQSGQNQDSRQFFNNGLTEGGAVLATTTTAATYTTVAKDFSGSPKTWVITPNLNTTISLSSTSTRDYIPNIGDTAEIMIKNASSTAAATVTFAAVDAGVDLQKNEDTADLAVNGLDWMKLTIVRTSKYAIVALMEEYIEAD